MTYFANLSRPQICWLIGSIIVAIGIVILGLAFEPAKEAMPIPSFSLDMSIKEIAPRLDVSGMSLARELDLPLKASKTASLEKLGIDQAQLDHAVEHILSHRPMMVKYYAYAAIVLWGLVFLTKLGRPEGLSVSQRKSWFPRTGYLIAILVAVIVCGFLLGKSPNPMEGIVKVFKAMVGLYPSVWEKVVALIFFLGLAVVGNKLICGWGCPFGALQELLYSLPILKKVKRRKVPFILSNTIRGGIFVAMLLILFGIVGGKRGLVIYHSINPFNLFDLKFDLLITLITTAIFLAFAFGVYRPFCQFVCPFGFVSWILERISLTRVRIDRSRCTKCGACAQKCPTTAAKSLVEGRLWGADCYSCARCLNACPEDAISYGCVFANPAKSSEAKDDGSV